MLLPMAQDQLDCTDQLLDGRGQSLDRSMLLTRIRDTRLKSGCAALAADVPPQPVNDAIKEGTNTPREYIIHSFGSQSSNFRCCMHGTFGMRVEICQSPLSSDRCTLLSMHLWKQ